MGGGRERDPQRREPEAREASTGEGAQDVEERAHEGAPYPAPRKVSRALGGAEGLV